MGLFVFCKTCEKRCFAVRFTNFDIFYKHFTTFNQSRYYIYIYTCIAGNWCGPSHPVNAATAAPPIDVIDTACYQHDYCYVDREESKCDAEFIVKMNEILSENTPESNLLTEKQVGQVKC